MFILIGLRASDVLRKSRDVANARIDADFDCVYLGLSLLTFHAAHMRGISGVCKAAPGVLSEEQNNETRVIFIHIYMRNWGWLNFGRVPGVNGRSTARTTWNACFFLNLF